MLNTFASLVVLAGSLGAGADVPPTINGVTPSPLPLGTTAEITGIDFQPNQTTVTIGGIPQPTLFTDATKAIIDVSLSTPLGTQPIVVTTPFGLSAAFDVEVVPAPPLISSVLPNPLVLGDLVTITGDWLDSVETVSLGGMPLTTTEVAATVVVAQLPLDMAMLGDHLLEVTGTTGSDSFDVTVVAPKPAIDTLAPNPARVGDLVTIKGLILPLNVSARVGGIPAIVTGSANGEVTAQVPPTLEPATYEVEVAMGAQWSTPVGPLHVQPADPMRPDVTAIYPVNVAAGGTAWLVGDNMERVTWLSGDDHISLGDCNDRGCSITIDAAAEPGPRTFALGGDEGTSVVQLEVSDSTLVNPVVTAADPSPAFRGETLTLTGTDLFGVSVVVIGGVSQTVDFVGDGEVRVTVSLDTPLGAEPLFVAGASASDTFGLTVLDPFPVPDEPEAEPEPDMAPEAGPDAAVEQAPDSGMPGADAGPDATTTPDADPGSGSDEGCASAGSGPPPWLPWLAILLILAARGVGRRRHMG